MENWIRTDERKDVLSSLSHTLLCVRNAQIDPTAWKWAILAFHNALQGAMVCHLTGTAQLGALYKDHAAEWLAWHRTAEAERGEVNPAAYAKLAKPDVLFRRLSKPKLRIEQAGSIISTSKPQKKSFEDLNKLRNEFQHFTPKGWRIEVSGLPKIFTVLLDILSQIVNDPWPFRHWTALEKDNLINLINELRHELQKAL